MSRLMTNELAEALKQYPLYSQDAKGKDAICVAVFFIGNIRWYVLEGQPEGDDYTIYSIVVGMDTTEYGYASIKEMESIEVKTGNALLPLVHIMQDKDFKPCQLCGIPDNELQEFLLEFERKN